MSLGAFYLEGLIHGGEFSEFYSIKLTPKTIVIS